VRRTHFLIFTDEGRELGPGFVNRSSPKALLAAFAGRAMAKEYKVRPQLAEFIVFSKKFLENLVAETEFNLVEEDLYTSFQRLQHQKGANYCKNMVEKHKKHLDGGYVRGFTRNSMFVKDEDNSKEGRPRPRGIMTMNDKDKIETVRILDIVHAFNDGPLSKYQIKNLTPEETRHKVLNITQGEHYSTDYSSYESSIDAIMRGLVCYLLELVKPRLSIPTDFITKYQSLTGHGRELVAKCGRFWLETEASGDYTTSFLNGIVNICLLQYDAHIQAKPITMIAEGDDGLTNLRADPGLIDDMGFYYSLACRGSGHGSVDFLRALYYPELRVLNVARCLRSLWVKKPELKVSKQKFLLRQTAFSLHYREPGHPILWALVLRILRDTAAYNTPFKNAERYLERNQQLRFGKLDVAPPTPEHRAALARGGPGIPAIPIVVQLQIEQQILRGDQRIETFGCLRDSDEFAQMLASNALFQPDGSVADTRHFDVLVDHLRQHKASAFFGCA